MGYPRRDFLKYLLGAVPLSALDWASFPRGNGKPLQENQADVIVIGAGLGGLSCAAAFARQGFKPLVLEQYILPGGYATAFSRPGGFVFDVSLHSTTVEERNGVYDLIPGFPEIEGVRFVPHPNLYRVIYPDRDIRVPQKDPEGYIRILQREFPEEKKRIAALFDAMTGYLDEINRYQAAGGRVDMQRFPVDYPHIVKYISRTWGKMLDDYIQDPKLKAVLSAQWGYYGLPPSQLASIYYALPFLGYLRSGGYYPLGRSQAISDAFVKFIRDKGGRVELGTPVERILVENRAAVGVRTAGGEEFRAKAVVSNADAYHTFHGMLDGGAYLEEYLARMDTFTTSLSSFQVWLGLKKDLLAETGIKDTEIFYETGYDVEAGYAIARDARVEEGGFGLTLYDNLDPDYSPQGKNTLNIMTLQGYDHWKPYEADYSRGEKTAYLREKNRMADILIEKVEKALLPGLSEAIEVREAATPLTNVRFTGNRRGAIYGWNQTPDNAMPRRLPNKTPVKNLYLVGAWTQPGGGYGAVIPSGLMCFAEILKTWNT